MPREPRRVEPLPRPFRLTEAQAAASPLHGRAVFVALPAGPADDRLRAHLAAIPGVRVTPQGSRLFADPLMRPWHAYQLDSDVGLGTWVGGAEFLALLRRYADDVYAPLTAGGEVLVDVCPEHANRWSVEAICSIYPDAVVVTDAATARELSPEARAHVRTEWTTDLLPAPPVRAATPTQGMSGSPLRDRLVVIVGAGRSGTTWLHDLWLTHPAVTGVQSGESWLFHTLRHLWPVIDAGVGFGSWLSRVTFLAATRRLCDGILVAARDRHGGGGSSYVVEKTPAHVFRLAEIAELYPDAWVVHLLRDGRDVAWSMAQVPFFGTPDVAAAAAAWVDAVAATRAAATRIGRFREVRYEDLVAAPDAQVRAQWRWAGLPDDVTSETLAAAVARPVSMHRGTAEPAARSWRDLPPGELAALHRVAGATLVAEGYATSADVRRARHPRRKSSIRAASSSGTSTHGK